MHFIHSTPIVHTDTRITPNSYACKGIRLSHHLRSPLAFCALAYSWPLCNDRRYPRTAPLTSTAKRPHHISQSRLPTHMGIPNPTGNNKHNKNDDSDSWLDNLLKEAWETYTDLPPTQKFYTQIIYLSVVISGALSMGATFVRVYLALLVNFEFGF